MSKYEAVQFACEPKHEHGALHTALEMVLSENKGALARAKRALDRVMAMERNELASSPRHRT
jgi:hypothetical protein